MAGAIATFLAFLLVPLYTRVFTPREYGVVALINVAIRLLAVAGSLGLPPAVGRCFYDSADLDVRRKTVMVAFWAQLSISLLLAIGLFILAPSVSTILTGSAASAALLRLAAATLPLTVVNDFVIFLCRIQRRTMAANALGTALALLSTSLIVLFLWQWRLGLEGLFLARLVAGGTTALIALGLLRGWIGRPSFAWSRLKELLRLGLPMLIAGLGLGTMALSDRLVLRLFRDTQEVGLYALAAAIAGLGNLAIGAFRQAWGPFAFSILGRPEAPRVYSKALDLYVFLGCLICFGLTFIAPLAVMVIAPPAYEAAATCVWLLGFALLLDGLRYIGGLGSLIAKQPGSQLASAAIGVVANIGLDLLLIPRFGKEGAAAATLLAFACSAAYLFAASHKLHPLPFALRPVTTYFLLALVSSGVAAEWSGPTPAAIALRTAMLILLVGAGSSLGLLRMTARRSAPGHARLP